MAQGRGPHAGPSGLTPSPGPPAGPLMNAVISAAIREDRDFVNEGRHRAREGTGEGGSSETSPQEPRACMVAALPGMAGGVTIVPQVPPKLHGHTLFGTNSFEVAKLGGKFTPSSLRGRIAIPVALGTFPQEEGEGVRMEVPGQPWEGLSWSVRVSPWHQERVTPQPCNPRVLPQH